MNKEFDLILIGFAIGSLIFCLFLWVNDKLRQHIKRWQTHRHEKRGK